MENKLIVFKTQTETVIGELVSQDDKKLTIKNPANVYIQPTQSGQLTVQLFPVFFNELIATAARNEGTVWEYDTAGIAVGKDVKFDDKLVSQYEKIFNPSPIVVPSSNDIKKIKMFDD